MAQNQDCLFCRIVRNEIDAKIVHEDEDLVAFRDISPQAPTHILIVPRQHIATLNDLTPDHQDLIGKMFLAAKDLAAQEGIEQSGYRCVFNCQRGAGQSVFHIHLHLLGGRALNWPPG